MNPKENPGLNKLKQLAQKAKDSGFVVEKKEQETRPVSCIEAETIMGDSFYGIASVFETFGTLVAANEIPKIPFSRVELEHAKQLGQQLILYIDKNSEGNPLTAAEINRLCENNPPDYFTATGSNWFEEDEYLKNTTPRMGWRLTSKECILESTSRNYLQQTHALIHYLENEVFPKGLPETYEKIIKDFYNKIDQYTLLFNSYDEGNKLYVSRELTDISLNQLCRENFAEVLYRTALHRHATEKLLLSSNSNVCFTITNSFTDDGLIVCLGDSTRTTGTSVKKIEMREIINSTGVCFSRGI